MTNHHKCRGHLTKTPRRCNLDVNLTSRAPPPAFLAKSTDHVSPGSSSNFGLQLGLPPFFHCPLNCSALARSSLRQSLAHTTPSFSQGVLVSSRLALSHESYLPSPNTCTSATLRVAFTYDHDVYFALIISTYCILIRCRAGMRHKFIR